MACSYWRNNTPSYFDSSKNGTGYTDLLINKEEGKLEISAAHASAATRIDVRKASFHPGNMCLRLTNLS